MRLLEEVGEEKSPWQDSPHLDEWDGLSARMGGGYDKRIFTSAEGIIVKGDEEEHEKHGDEFFEFPTVNRPEEGSPFPKMIGANFLHISILRFFVCPQHRIFGYLIKRGRMKLK